MNRPYLWLLATTFVLVSHARAGEATIERYDVRGSTYDELVRSMREGGPVSGRTGRSHYGITEVGFRPRWTLRPVDGGCELVSAVVDLDVRIVVPRWVGREAATSALRTRWDALRDDVERHERQHEAIARDWRERMFASLNEPARGASCDALSRTLTDRAQAIVDRHRDAQLRFDGLR